MNVDRKAESDKVMALQSADWRLWLEPGCGVQWLAAEVRDANGQWQAVVPECRAAGATAASEPRAGQDESAPLAAACFHMIPYSNRLRDGHFTFDGKAHQLDGAGKHAIHGALRKLPWQVVRTDDSSLSAVHDSREHGPVNWPWPMRATVDYKLEGKALRSRITITNRGESNMPAGTGWHPYFVRRIADAGPELTLPVSGVFPDADGDCLPDGDSVALPAALDFRARKPLAEDVRIDRCLTGLDGSIGIRWPDAGIALSLTASANCRFLVLYNPDRPHFAVEPVTNANDGFNLDARGIDGGTTRLAPGESLVAEMVILVA